MISECIRPRYKKYEKKGECVVIPCWNYHTRCNIMIEMELKALLKNKLQVKKKLEECGCEWVSVGLQVDTIYERSDAKQIVDTSIFRIRKYNDKKILTLKILMEDLDTAEELELDISDDIVMDKMLQFIGFLPKIQVVKRRQTAKYKEFNICIDEVEGLGDFIEIERISEKSNDKDRIYGEMRTVLLELGVEEEELKKEKYYEMILKNREEKYE